MKKSTAGLTLAVIMGFSALSATPAMAEIGAYSSCAEAEAVGVFNIPAGAPGYSLNLDRNKDGVACEKAGVAYRPAPVVQAPVAVESPVAQAPVVVEAPVAQAPVAKAPAAKVAPAAGVKQIVRVPVGGADTGVATKNTDNTGVLALGGGLVLALAAAGTFVVRRRNA